MASELSLGKYVVAVLLIGKSGDCSQGNRFRVFQISRLATGQQAEECSRPSGAGVVFLRLQVEYRVKPVPKHEMTLRSAS